MKPVPTFQESLEAYGADCAGILQRFMGDEAMYRRILGLLFQDGNLKKLGAALDAGDLTSAFEAAHTLKGVAGNLGLTPLYGAVCAIVEPLRRRDAECGYAALYRAVQEEFRRVEALWEELKASGGIT